MTESTEPREPCRHHRSLNVTTYSDRVNGRHSFICATQGCKAEWYKTDQRPTVRVYTKEN